MKKTAAMKKDEQENRARALAAQQIILDGVRSGETRICPTCKHPIAWRDIEAMHTDYGTFFSVEQVYEIIYRCYPVSLWEMST